MKRYKQSIAIGAVAAMTAGIVGIFTGCEDAHMQLASGTEPVALAPTSATCKHRPPRKRRPILTPRTRLYVPDHPNALATRDALEAEGRTEEADRMAALADIPQSVWLVGGTPNEVKARVRDVIHDAKRKRQTPVFVAYYVPGRDCSQYSGGGASSEADYKAWIDALAKAIGRDRAVVLIEPDGVALLSSEPWCGEGGGGFTGEPEDIERVSERFREIRYAVERLSAQPRIATYIDAGHSSWHGLNDYDAYYGVPSLQFGIVSRLLLAGIKDADGFFLNTSNTRANAPLVTYGTRIAKCLYLIQNDPDYQPPTVYEPEAVYDENGAFAMPCPSNDVLDAMPLPPRAAKKMAHFVIDSSRNGQGPWNLGDPDTADDDSTAFFDAYGFETTDPEIWCNAPGRGLGVRPTTRTGHPLLDAYLWIKVPGESDGQCGRNLTAPDPSWPAQFDIAWQEVDPPAGEWFVSQILELTALADPPLID